MHSYFSKWIGVVTLTLGVLLTPAIQPATAQTNTNDNPTVDTTPFQETNDDANNLGWLGLLGLIGLANLLRKPKTANTYSDRPTSRL